MNKTAMTILKDKLLDEYQNLKDDNDHTKGYREALKNIANDIDAQMMEVERQMLLRFYYDGQKYVKGKWADDQYDEIYGTKNK
jgi:hypothetical protein